MQAVACILKIGSYPAINIYKSTQIFLFFSSIYNPNTISDYILESSNCCKFGSTFIIKNNKYRRPFISIDTFSTDDFYRLLHSI